MSAVPGNGTPMDPSEMHARALAVLDAIHSFERELRAHPVRRVADATGLPINTVQRWKWHHSRRWLNTVVDRLTPDDATRQCRR